MDDETSREAGFDGASLTFMPDDSGQVRVGTADVGDVTSDPTATSNDDGLSPSFFASTSAWDFQGSPNYDSYGVTSGAASTVQPSFVDPSWQLPLFSQQAGTPGAKDSTQSEMDSSALFAFNSDIGGQSRGPSSKKPQFLNVSTLTPELHEKLRNIAMPSHRRYTSTRSASSLGSADGEPKGGTLSSPDDRSDSRKRKVSAELDDDEEEDEDGKPVKKTAHNMIEKRYRTNINDKIAALRDSVPSLRIMSKSARGEDTTEDREELHGLTPAHKLNKATVLSKATEYIRHLEKRNAWLMDENSAMHARIGAFEKLFMAGAMNGSINTTQHPQRPIQCCPETQQPFTVASMDRSPDPDENAVAVGMIDVPEDMKRIISEQMAVGQPYPVPQQPYRGSNTVCRQQQIQQQQQEQTDQNGWASVSPYIGKLMVGSLAGLMILEAFREEEINNERPEGRGLFALPTEIMRHMASGLDLHVMGYRIHTSLKFLLFLGTFLWIFVPSLFSIPETDIKKQRAGVLRPAPSLASPIDVRRRAWLTAVQNVWVPRHNFFLEAAALMLKTIKLSLRNIIGVHGYQMLTGLTQEQEAARVKAWSIALDSQLAGGDVEVCKSRLVLTLLASGTLPDSPIRLMLKALHIRVLLWELGHTRLPLGVVNTIAAKLARWQWNEARQLNRISAQLRRTTSVESEDELPDYLAALVELECDEVLSSAVVQRAHNLAFNLDTTQDVESNIDGMDAVVEDTAIGSPMDAVAAWWSTEFLHIILTATLDEDVKASGTRAEDIELAVRVTPIGSIAQNRAVLARAALLDRSRGANIAAAIEALKRSEMQSPLSNTLSIVGLESQSSKVDFRLALRCATALAHLGREGSTTKACQAGFRLAESIMTPWDAACMSLLGFTAAMELVERLSKSRPNGDISGASLERLSANLRYWMDGTAGISCGLSPSVRNKLMERCRVITKNLAEAELDTGYGSLSDGDSGRH